MQPDIDIQSGGSGTLLTQIQAGATPDLLLLADHQLVERLDQQTILKHTVVASNELRLVKRKGSTEVGPEPLANPRLRLALASADTAPLGRYSRQALSRGNVEADIVTVKNATAVASTVLSGHCELGIVYESDIHRFSQLETVLKFSPESHDPILYRMVLFQPGESGATKLYESLASVHGKKLLEEAHFGPPPGDGPPNMR